tara:strand:+ start:269 stop:439 length:171 start_codon:yes stop_codon:yes gene_type:complete
MRLLIYSKPGWRLFKDKNLVGLPRWVIRNDSTKSETIFNGVWYNREKILKIFKDIE